MRRIPSSSICNFFYVFFVIYAILFVMAIISTAGVFLTSKKLGPAGIAVGIQGLVMTGLGGTMMLFYYLICDRAIIGKAVKDVNEHFTNPPFKHCITSVTCGAGEICDNYICKKSIDNGHKEGCSTDRDCSRGEKCHHNMCMPSIDNGHKAGCSTDRDCSRGEQCYHNMCMPIRPGKNCSDGGHCLPGSECHTDGMSKKCLNGTLTSRIMN